LLGSSLREGGPVLDSARDIQSLSHFKRNTAEVMKRLKESGNPVVLTVHGKAEVVVQDAAAYQRLINLAEKAEMIEFLREARADADASQTVPARDFLGSLGKTQRPSKT
jgi:prevent-host-death family protein